MIGPGSDKNTFSPQHLDGFESNGESIEEEKGSHHNISLILDWGDVKKEPKGGSLNIES